MKIPRLISFFLNKKKKNLVNPEEDSMSPIHPLFIQLTENAVDYLLKNGFRLFSQKSGQITYFNRTGIYITFLNQGYDYPEVYVGKDDNIQNMIRLNFILEFYLSKSTEIFKKHKVLNHFYAFEYEAELLNSYLSSIMGINPFPQKYEQWVKLNDQTIMNEIKDLN